MASSTSSRRTKPRVLVIVILVLIILNAASRLYRVVFFSSHTNLYQLPLAVGKRAVNETSHDDALPFVSQPAVSNATAASLLEQALDQSQLFFSSSMMDTSLPKNLSVSVSQPESSFPTPPSARENAPSSFSACLLIMDDNNRLSEWLAYHYFVLPLRHIVIAVDPASRTLPHSILNRWRPYMNVTVWSDDDFGFNKTGENTKAISVKTNQHRTRQRHFYKHCTAHLNKLNQTWTTYHDIDEFVSINSLLVNNSDTRMGKSGSILSLLQDFRTQPLADPVWSGACITLPRILYSAVESTDAQRQRDVPSLVDARQFETLRWRYRTSERDSYNNLKAKAIMDVSRVPTDVKYFEVHRPIKSICPPATVTMHVSPIAVHHYLGSWETYSYRDDARKGNEKNRVIWEYRSTLQDGGANDEVRPWIQGFVRMVGEDVARQLLRDVGLPTNYTTAASVDATWDAKGAWKEESAFGRQNAGFAAFLQHRMANATKHQNATQRRT
jgi:hypothetical protein